MGAEAAPDIASAGSGRIRTPAELSVLDRLQALAGGGTAGEDARDNVIALIRENGLPHRRIEAWKYTDLRTLLGEVPPLAVPPESGAASAALKAGTAFVDAARLPVVNGQVIDTLADSLPQGVTQRKAADGGGEADEPPGAADAIGLFHRAFATPGLALAVATGARPDRAIALVHAMSGAAPALAATGHSVTVGEGAAATVIDHQTGPDGVAYLTNTRNTVQLGENARLHWIIVQEEGDEARHLGQLKATLARGARLDLTVLNAGGALVRREIMIDIAGCDAELAIRGVNLIGGSAHVDVTTTLNHRAPAATASEVFRNIVTDRGTGIFQGQINVDRLAQKTDAQMACNTLLLSQRASFSAKPELEIFADDVVCGHGATCGQIDSDVLFFLRARGIPADIAEKMMVMAFLAGSVAEIEDVRVQNALATRIGAWIGLPPDETGEVDG